MAFRRLQFLTLEGLCRLLFSIIQIIFENDVFEPFFIISLKVSAAPSDFGSEEIKDQSSKINFHSPLSTSDEAPTAEPNSANIIFKNNKNLENSP